MKKITMFPKGQSQVPQITNDEGCLVNTAERITIQFRSYDEKGNYDKKGSITGNATIHLKNMTLNEAYETVKASLLNSRLIDECFEVEE